MTNAQGLDISVWNDDNSTPQMFTPEKAYAAGARFVFVKASEGVFIDPDYLANWTRCRGKLYRGAYHFFTWKADAVAQARFFAGVLQAGPGELPPVVDYESRTGVPDRVTAVSRLEQFVSEFERITGRQLMVYTSPSFWREFGSTAAHWAARPLWIANYQVSKPTVPAPWANWDFWQYTDKGDGLAYGAESKNIDMNWYNGSLEEMLERFDVASLEPKPTETQLDRIERKIDKILEIVEP